MLEPEPSKGAIHALFPQVRSILLLGRLLILRLSIIEGPVYPFRDTRPL